MREVTIHVSTAVTLTVGTEAEANHMAAKARGAAARAVETATGHIPYTVAHVVAKAPA